jgi:LacI family transcriptional regulator
MCCCYSDFVATIEDVARLAGVSATTAKRAIRQPELLATETLAQVQKAIAMLQYEPDLVAGALRRGRNKTIGLMVGDILEPVFAQFTRVIGEEVRRRGYSLLLADDQYDADIELKNLRMFSGQRISGLIIRPAYASNYDYLRQLEKRGVAIVELDYTQPGSPFSHVMLQNEEAMFEGVSYLYRLGHRRIAYVGRAALDEYPEERFIGFTKAVKHYNLSLPELYIAPLPRYSEDLAFERTRQLLNLPEPPTALFTYNGTCTLSAYKAVKEKGLTIPKDITLLGFDNYPWTSLVSPALAVFEQPIEAMAAAAVDMVLSQIEGNANVSRKRFPATLIERESCAAPRAVEKI